MALHMGFRKIIYWSVATVLFFFIGFGLYVYEYRSLSMEAWKLFNDRCNNVNPLLIKVRNIHLGLGAALSGQATPSAEQFGQNLKIFPIYTNQYLAQEKIWIEKQKALLNRRDFQLLEPGFFQTVLKYHVAIYQAYYDYYQVVSDIYKAGNMARETDNKFKFDNDPVSLMSKYLNERKSNQKLYLDAFEKGRKTQDWRKYFVQFPALDCPEENLEIQEYYSPSPTPLPSIDNSFQGNSG
jgi:hypothetical protein